MTFDAAVMEAATAALPFLPRGKGALILILGGLAMLAVSLLSARFSSGRVRLIPAATSTQGYRVGQPPAHTMATQTAARRHTRAVASAATVHLPAWVAGIEGQVERMQLGQGHVVRADADHCVVELAGCGSCRTRRRGAPRGCAEERRSIEQAVAVRAPWARVTEVACDAAGDGSCTFEIVRGRPV